MEKKCLICYKVIDTKIVWSPCCSRICLTQYAIPKKPHRIKYCVICNVPFYFFPYEKDRRCCSSKCAHQSLKGTINYKNRKKVNLSCDVCETFFQRPPCHVREKNYCSVKCKGESSRGRISPNKKAKFCLRCNIKIANSITESRGRTYCSSCHHQVVSDWWKNNNPMRNKESSLKQSETRKILFKEGKLNRYFMRNLSDEQKQEMAEKHSIQMKERWKDKDYRDKVITNWLKATQNQPSSYEKKFDEICQENNLPFRYVGNGAFLLGGKNPDFINVEKKICIEVFASFMKKKEFGSVENWMKIREEHFGKYGYKVIFFNEKEYSNKDYIIRTLSNV